MANAAPATDARWRQLLENGRWTLRVIFETSPRVAWGLIGLTLLRGLVPAGLALAGRGLINAAVGQLDAEAFSLAPVVPWLLTGLCLALVEAVGSLAHKLLVQRLGDDLHLRVNSEILSHAATLDLPFFEDTRMQDVIARAREGAGSRFSVFFTEGQRAAMFAVQVTSLVAVLVVLEPLTLLVIPLAVPFLLHQWALARRRYETQYHRTKKMRWSSYFLSRLTSIPAVAETRLLGLAPLLQERFGRLMRDFRRQNRRLQLQEFGGSAAFALVSTAAFYLVFLRVAWRVLHESLTVGDLAVFGGATARLRSMLDNGIRSATTALEQSLYVANVRAFLEAKPRVASGARALPRPVRGEIRVEDVHFTYPGSSQPALRGLSFEVRPGETVAIVGGNGAGKSTLVKLIARLYDPDEGSITFDGVPLRELDLAELHRHVSYLGQSFGRYEASAAENIAYGDWRELLEKRDRVERIARLAGVDDLVRQLPESYDTPLGRLFGHCELSGGQWQRLAVARQLARDAELLILDEPSSNLDPRAENELLETLKDLARDRTTLLISHRFSTVGMADRILVMDEGQLAESGTHAQLVAAGGPYAQLYALHERHRVELASELPEPERGR